MRAYVIVTGSLFALITIAHVLRMITESRTLATDPARQRCAANQRKKHRVASPSLFGGVTRCCPEASLSDVRDLKSGSSGVRLDSRRSALSSGTGHLSTMYANA